MTAFKFGKKKKDKNEKSNSQFSSPSSQKTANNTSTTNHSPQTSTYSSNSHSNLKQFSSANPTSSSPGVNINQTGNVPQQGVSPQYNGQQRGYSNSQSLGYDHNNNIYNPRSPQRGGQQYNTSPQKYTNEPPAYSSTRGYPQQYNQQQIPSPWSRAKLSISPFPRYRHAASNLTNDKGEIFVMGGLHNTSVYGDTWIIKQDNDNKSFQTFQVDMYENSPAPRVGHASTLCGNAYVIFGGDTVTNDAGEIDNDLYLFNMNTHTWTIPHPVGEKPSGRYGHSIGVVAVTNFDSKLYLYGGQLDDVVYNDLVMFNLSSFRRPDVQWEWVVPENRIQPPGLTNHTMDVYDNKLWLFGGSTGQKLSNDLWCFDPSQKSWELVKTTGESPKPVEEHASVIYDDLLVVYGGKNFEGEAVSDVSFLNLITKTWFKLPHSLALEPQGKYGHSLSILKNNKLLILGGHLPDYAKLGNDLEPSLQDHGVGTILHTLDMSNITKLVPGLYQYSTPGNIAQEKFASGGNSNIFTPPSSQPQQPLQMQSNPYVSPEKAHNATVPLPRSSASLSSSNSKSYHQRELSKSTAEEAFQHDYDTSRQQYQSDVVTPSKNNVSKISQLTPPASSRQSTPVQGQHLNVNSYADPEEDLPLDIPSPIKSQDNDLPIPAPIQKEEISQPIFNDEISLKEDKFETPSASPVDRPIVAQEYKSAASESYLQGEAKGSDFLDNYVNNNSTSSLQDKLEELDNSRFGSRSTSISEAHNNQVQPALKEVGLDRKSSLSTINSNRKDSVISNNAVFGIGSAASAVVGTGLKNVYVKGSSNSSSPSNESPTLKDIPGSFPNGSGFNNGLTPSTNTTGTTRTTTKNDDERQQFKTIINSLSAELEQLKLSTNQQVKLASSKVSSLEAENEQLKSQLAGESLKNSTEDDSEIKRKHIKLNTDYALLNDNHQKLKSQYDEITPVFNSNIIDLSKLNEIIKAQELEIESNNKKIINQENWKQKFEKLKLEYDSLLEKSEEIEEINSRSLQNESLNTKSLTDSIDTFLKKYASKDEVTGEFSTRDLSVNNCVSSGATESLRAQIDDLLEENDVKASENRKLLDKIESLEKSNEELDSLKAKVAELSKYEDNYKDSLHTVKNSSRALQISQSELSKQKELSIKLQSEIDELKIFKASRKSSRNATPVINDFNKADETTSDVEDDDIENEHYNLKLRDLQAELFITKQERDDLKQDVLNLKKKLLVSSTPSNSL